MDDRNQSGGDSLDQNGQAGKSGGQNQDRQQNVDRQQNQQGSAKTGNANRDDGATDTAHQGGASGQDAHVSHDIGGQSGGGQAGGDRGVNSGQR